LKINKNLLNEKFVENLKRDEDVLAVMIFGSYPEVRKEKNLT